MMCKIIKMPFLLIVGFITIILGGIFGITNLFLKKNPNMYNQNNKWHYLNSITLQDQHISL